MVGSIDKMRWLAVRVLTKERERGRDSDKLRGLAVRVLTKERMRGRDSDKMKWLAVRVLTKEREGERGRDRARCRDVGFMYRRSTHTKFRSHAYRSGRNT